MSQPGVVEGQTRLKKRAGRRDDITAEQIEIFFATLAETCNVVRSAKAAGFSTNWAYRRRKFDGAFRNGWMAAVRDGYANLEVMLLERAMKGTPKLVRTARGGDRLMREYSTPLAAALLRRHAEMADSANYEPAGDELREVRERILDKLERLRERENRNGPIEKKGMRDPVELICWALARSRRSPLQFRSA